MLECVPYMVPRLSYLICTTPRSGSNLLCTTLWQTGIAGRPQEYFMPGLRDEFIRYAQLGVSEHPDYVRAVIRASTTPNGIFGTSVHAFQTALVMKRIQHAEGKEFFSFREAVETAFPNIKYIFLTRVDKVAQAVSYYRAVMTGEWRRFSDEHIPESNKTIKMDHYGIKKCLELLEQSDAYWEKFFEEHELSPLRITFEDLTRKYGKTVQNILSYLELPAVPIPPPATKKISDERSKSWEEEFIQLEKKNPIHTEPTNYAWAPF